jgi:hypothetical protein
VFSQYTTTESASQISAASFAGEDMRKINWTGFGSDRGYRCATEMFNKQLYMTSPKSPIAFSPVSKKKPKKF